MNFTGINHSLRCSPTPSDANEVCKQANDVLLCMKMILLEKIVVFLISLAQVHPSVCSHFRGGTFTYKPADQSNPANTTVSFRDQTMQRVCTMSTIHGNFVYVYFSVYPLDLHHVFKKG